MKVVGIIPAAGEGRRMGGPKLNFPHRGSTFLQLCIDALTIGGTDEIRVVVAPGMQAEGCTVLTNPDPSRGMISSVQIGLGDGQDAYLVLPVDCPDVSSDTVAQVIEGLRGGAALAVPAYRGRRGHPLGLNSEMATKALGLRDVGLNALLRLYDALQIEVDDEGCLKDYDSRSDF